MWENKFTQAHDVALLISIRLNDFFFHNTKVDVSMRANSKWLPPPVGWLKVNVDGAFDDHTRKGSLGFLICDLHGTYRGGACKPLSNLFLAEHAELLAC